MVVTLMAVLLDSTLFWLVATIMLISELIYICKDKPISDRKFALLIVSIIVFVILFISNDLKREIQTQLGFRHRYRPATPIKRKHSLSTRKRTPITTSLTLEEMAERPKKESTNE